MKKSVIIILLSSLTIISILILLSINTFTGAAIQETNIYTHTKAICNSTNYCQDYEITCEGQEIISSTPISGAVIQHNPDWQDPRSREAQELCK